MVKVLLCSCFFYCKEMVLFKVKDTSPISATSGYHASHSVRDNEHTCIVSFLIFV